MNRKVLAKRLSSLLLVTTIVLAVSSCTAKNSNAAGGYQDLLALFEDWREFENPPLRDGAPDYTVERFEAAHAELKGYQSRLNAIETSGWPIDQQVDWHLLRAEMNGFDFNHRVLKSWARDPAFYQTVWTAESDTPAHEGPMHHAILDLWTYEFPLSPEDEAKIT